MNISVEEYISTWVCVVHYLDLLDIDNVLFLVYFLGLCSSRLVFIRKH